MERRTRIPESFEVSARVVELAKANGWPDPHRELEAFKDYHLAKGSLMVDWEAAFRTWLRNAVKFNAGKQQRVYTPEPRPVRTKADRPAEPRHDPRVKELLAGLVNKLEVKP